MLRGRCRLPRTSTTGGPSGGWRGCADSGGAASPRPRHRHWESTEAALSRPPGASRWPDRQRCRIPRSSAHSCLLAATGGRCGGDWPLCGLGRVGCDAFSGRAGEEVGLLGSHVCQFRGVGVALDLSQLGVCDSLVLIRQPSPGLFLSLGMYLVLLCFGSISVSQG
ncbi:hypothetical protein ACFFX0_32720 [Citricoccus parietis]|uniref:Uncharacterized protein n=1 Tax=Citricoccus parietis TaxID=592307 RepID=A0ABV5G9P3_9MICC